MANSARGRPSVTIQNNWLAEEDEADMQPPPRAQAGDAAAAAMSPKRQLDAMKLSMLLLMGLNCSITQLHDLNEIQDSAIIRFNPGRVYYESTLAIGHLCPRISVTVTVTPSNLVGWLSLSTRRSCQSSDWVLKGVEWSVRIDEEAGLWDSSRHLSLIGSAKPEDLAYT